MGSEAQKLLPPTLAVGGGWTLWLLPILVAGTLTAENSTVRIEPVAPQLASYVTLRPAMLDPELASLLTPKVLSEITPMLPYSVIAKNISGEALRGLNVVFTEGSRHYSFASINLDSVRPAQFAPDESKLFIPHTLIDQGLATATDQSAALAALLARSPQKVEHDIFTPSDRYTIQLRRDIQDLQRRLQRGQTGELEQYQALVAQEISITK